MLWLAIYFPDLSLELFAQQHFANTAQQSQRPMIVLENNRVCLRNTAAREQGIVLGATLATAHSICPTLLHQQREPAAEALRLEQLANSLYRFSSHISIQEPDCILLEIGGSLRLYGDHEALSQAAVELCRTLTHVGVARVAQTPWAAIALARAQQTNLAAVPLVTAGLELAGVSHQAIERFDNMGIYTLGPLLELPSQQIGKRFGKKLLVYLEQLTGVRPDPRPAIHPAPHFKQHLHLLEPIRDKAALVSGPMTQLANELQYWLIAHQLGCSEICWQFQHQQTDKETALVTLRFANPRQNAEEILAVSQLRLEQASLPEEVLSIGLKARHTHPWSNQSQPLFQLGIASASSDMYDVHDEPAFGLVDELNARLGRAACTGITCLAQHTPELAWCAYTGKAAGDTATSKSLTGKRPMWLFDPPHQISRDELTLKQGPERIQSSWWRQTTCRDYYIAQHHSGAECWAFMDAQKRWYLHGYFS